MTPEALTRHLAPVVRDFVAQELAPIRAENQSLKDEVTLLRARLDELPTPKKGERGERGEKGDPGPPGPQGKSGGVGIQGPKGERGEAGEDGKDADEEKIFSRLVKRLDERVAQIPVPRDGRDGRDGEKGEQGPKGEKGDPGPPGPKGEVGPQGERGIDISDIYRNEKEETIIALSNGVDFNLGILKGDVGPQGERGPAGPKGDTGERGENGERGPAGPKGDTGERGEVGVGVERAFINQEGDLVLIYSNKTEANLGPVIGPEGPAGARGYGFDDLRFEYDGERRIKAVWERGDTRDEQEFVIPVSIHRGVWKEETLYERGDNVTWAGSTWIATKETSDKPNNSEEWQLVTKRGRDGKDGKDGPKGEPGPAGRAGRDLTQMGPDGSKW